LYDVDVLLIAHKRSDYLALSLPRMLDSLPEGARAWVWQNDEHPGTTEVIAQHRSHSRFFRYHRSPQNQRLTEPTNWLWRNATGQLLGKVDDDCLVSPGWVEAFTAAHEVEDLGIIASWHFQPDELLPETIQHRTEPLSNGRSLIRNCWVGGSGYLMKRLCVNEQGLLRDDRSFTHYCFDLARTGWSIGWHYPLVLQDHMDDPRSSYTAIRSDDDLVSRSPLSVTRLSAPTVAAWDAQLRNDAICVQTASLRPQDHQGWRRRWRSLRSRFTRSSEACT
jgi:glycosyltransferase involved in cell wall biosynthesis